VSGQTARSKQTCFVVPDSRQLLGENRPVWWGSLQPLPSTMKLSNFTSLSGDCPGCFVLSVLDPMYPYPNGVLARGLSKDQTCENPMVGWQGVRTGVESVSVRIVRTPDCCAILRVYWHFYWEHSVRRNRWRWVIRLCVTKQRSEFTVIPTRINVHKTITLLIP